MWQPVRFGELLIGEKFSATEPEFDTSPVQLYEKIKQKHNGIEQVNTKWLDQESFTPASEVVWVWNH